MPVVVDVDVGDHADLPGHERRAHAEGREPFDRLERRQPHRFRVDEDHVRFNHRPDRREPGRISASASASRRARAWSSCEPRRALVERDQAGRGHDPGLPPGAAEQDLQIRRASRISSAGPQTSEPIGAPSPFETQNIIVSTSRTSTP